MKLSNKLIAILLLIIAVSLSTSWAKLSAAKTGDSLVDSKALTIQGGFGQGINGLSFQQDAVITHAGHQYAGYYDANRQVCLARRKLPAGDWKIIRFTDYDFRSNDAHNIISIGICPKDGTIHMAFDHHVHPLHYRVSRKGAANNPESITWDASLFKPITSELEKGKPIKVTYPRFWQTPEGGLQFCYRQGGSGNGDRMLVDYNAQTDSWSGTRQIDSSKGTFKDSMGQSNSRCSYPNGYDYGPDGKLHVTWVWRESSQGSNHDLMYAYSEDQGNIWLNNAGKPLAEPPHVNSPGITAANISRLHGLMNTHGQAVDSQGRIHVVMWHCSDQTLQAAGSKPGRERWGPPQARRYHHYWRSSKGRWNHHELPWVSGNRSKIFIDKFDNAYIIYGMRRQSVELADGHLHSAGDLVIAAATEASKWKDWKVIHIEKGPFINEMLGDLYRWKKEGLLSVMVQQSPTKAHEPTPLRILDFSFEKK
ncbi:MAG: BNR repeat-containing protein [Sedimentisphaerales bacterium]|nr:BNR repeat-containing protein [Sedimentisphaerales bacterium]